MVGKVLAGSWGRVDAPVGGGQTGEYPGCGRIGCRHGCGVSGCGLLRRYASGERGKGGKQECGIRNTDRDEVRLKARGKEKN